MVKHICVVSGKEIPKERVEALEFLGIPESQWTCVEHSITKPRQGIFMGEHGTSELLMVDKVYDDSVRAVFKGCDREASEEPVEETPTASLDPKPGFYTEKEINYYTTGEDPVDSDEVNIVKKLDT